MRIYPSPGLLVRDPVKRDFLPESGREVPDGDIYWSRRLNCNDATLTPPAPEVSAPAKAEKNKAIEGSDSQ